MKKVLLKILLVVTAVVLLSGSLLACTSKTATETTPAVVYKWRLQTHVNAGSLPYDSMAVPFANLVKEKSKGRLLIEVYPNGAIVGMMDIANSVAKGIIEMGEGGPALDLGILPEAQPAAGLPFGWTSGRQTYEFFYEYKDGEAGKILNSAYNTKGLELLKFMPFEDEYLAMTTFPVTSVADFKGKKMRATGNYGKIMAQLGCSTVNTALSEVYTAVQTGVVEGVVQGLSTLEDFKLKDVLKYVIKPAFSPGMGCAFYVNLNTWNALPDDLKKIVNDAAEDTYLKTLLPASIKYKDNMYNNVIPQSGMKIQTLSAAETTKYMAATAPIWTSVGAAAEKNAQIMTLLKQFLDSKKQSYPGK